MLLASKSFSTTIDSFSQESAMPNFTCEICGFNRATIEVINSANKKQKSIKLCKECNREAEQLRQKYCKKKNKQ